MVDITHKSFSLRYAKAKATVKVSDPETIRRIKNHLIPKGDVLEMAKTAGLFAIKKTAEMIPDCHPIPVEYCKVEYEIKEQEIDIFLEVKTVYRTGVEVEAMHGVSVVALTMYDMLKPVDKDIEIASIRLLEKKGGKRDRRTWLDIGISASVLVCSDSVHQGEKEDRAGRKLLEILETERIEIKNYKVIPDHKNEIEEALKKELEMKTRLVIYCGGTGLGEKDITPDVVRPFIEKEIPGIAEAMRNYGQDRTPFSMLSRSLAGLIGNTLVLVLPGSTKGAEESLRSIFPSVLHIFKVMDVFHHT